jgi:hypothetical protein
MAQADHVTTVISALIIDASPKRSTSPILSAYTELVAALITHRPRPIPIDIDTIDVEDRANHLKSVFAAISSYVGVILDDTAWNVPGGLDFGDVEAALSDLTSDVTGTIQLAADAMAAGRVA